MPTSLLLCVFMKSSTEHTHHQLTDYVGDPSSTACGGIRVEKLCWDDGKDCRGDRQRVICGFAQLDGALEQMWVTLTHLSGCSSPCDGVQSLQPCTEAGKTGGAGSWWRWEAGLAAWTSVGGETWRYKS